MDGTQRLPGPGAGTGWDSGEDGQHRSRRGFCPTCDAACCSGETPGLEAAARKAGIARLSLAGEQQHRGGCKSLHAAWLPNHGPLPKRRSLPAGAGGGVLVSPASTQQQLLRANSHQGWSGESRGLGRRSGTSRGPLLHGQQGPWARRSLVASSRPAWLRDSGLPSSLSRMPRRWPRR